MLVILTREGSVKRQYRSLSEFELIDIARSWSARGYICKVV